MLCVPRPRPLREPTHRGESSREREALDVEHGRVSNVRERSHVAVAERLVEQVVGIVVHSVVDRDLVNVGPREFRKLFAEVLALLVGNLYSIECRVVSCHPRGGWKEIGRAHLSRRRQVCNLL